jgi:hypothetical protein
MLTRGISRFSLGMLIAATAVAGCGARSPGIVPNPQTQSRASGLASEHLRAWMLPEASSETLLYYSDGNSTVYVLSYPKGKLVGTLGGFDGAQGLCADKNGNVFVTTYATEAVYEYAHGGTQPIAKLGDYGYYPGGCAVDPVTGNLAVANTEAMNGNPGNVAIYTGAQGQPVDYAAAGIDAYDWCAYDGAGNLYVNGGGLAQMPYGSHDLTSVNLGGITGAGIQWDGEYLAMVNPSSKAVYRLAIAGSSGNVVDTVDLTGLFTLLGNDFALQSGNMVMPYGGGAKHRVSRIGQWKYPKGGAVGKTIHRVNFLYDLTLSV